MKLHNKLLILYVLIVSFFVIFPEIDQFAAKNLYMGRHYFSFYPAYKTLLVIFVVLVFFVAAYQAYIYRKKNDKFALKRAGLIIFTLLIPAGVLVQLLKETFKRPRPRQIILLDGNAEFSKLLEFNFFKYKSLGYQSFPSGDVALAAALISVFICFMREKGAFIWAFFISLLFAMGRMMKGAHFLSDVVSSYFIVTVSYYWMRDKLDQHTFFKT